MDKALIAKLLRGPIRKSSTGTAGYALVKTSDGQLERVPLSEVEVGGFIGRQGTIKRSRKGHSVIQANGQRYYAPYGKSEVVAYRT